MRGFSLLPVGLAVVVAGSSGLAQAAQPPHAVTAPARVAAAEVLGRTLEKPEKLLAFLGLAPGAPVDDPKLLQARVDEALAALGYFVLEERFESAAPGDGGLRVHLRVEPARVVRHVSVHGNWPVFDDEIRRRLTLRPGSRLPPAAELPALLQHEAERVKDFLVRDGYFDGDVDVVVEPDGRPEWVNLDVLVHLGHWYRLTNIQVTGATVLGPSDFLKFFGSRKPWWLGRLRIEALRDDAHDAEVDYRERGYPAARVLPSFDPARDLDRRTGRTTLHVRVLEKARVEVRFVGNKHLPEKQLRDKLTLFTSGSYDEVELQESARELFRLYQSNGFLQARVDVARRRAGGVEDVTFTIDEGPELKVRAVEFVPEIGAAPLTADDKALRAVVATRPFPKLGAIGLGEGGFVTLLQLQQDAEKIVAWERARGFPDARARGELARDPAAFGRAGVLAADVASTTATAATSTCASTSTRAAARPSTPSRSTSAARTRSTPIK